MQMSTVTMEDVEVLVNWMQALESDLLTASNLQKISDFIEAVQNETKLPDIQEVFNEVEELGNMLEQIQYRLKTIKEIVVEMKEKQ
jgi:ferritin